MINILRAVHAAQIVSTMGRNVLPNVQITRVIRQMAKKMRTSCQSFAAKSG